jgi:hypothetical protein
MAWAARKVSLLLLTLCCATGHAQEVTLIGVGSLPGDATDLSGLSGTTLDGTPHNRLGGLGSAIAYTGNGNLYVVASDRGPQDGASDFQCRLHLLNIVVEPEAQTPVRLRLASTVLLRDEQGRPLVGSLQALDPSAPQRSLRFDPEGVRVGPAGTFFVSDEYGPWIWEFDRSGRRLRSLPVPAKWQPAHPSARPQEELPPRNLQGRQPNRGLEGLAITPDGQRLLAILQSPLIQDGALDAGNRRIGVHVRMLQFDLAEGQSKEFVYPLEDPGNGVSEILAINSEQFLVLERDGKAGLQARCKKVFRIDTRSATDVRSRDRLPSSPPLPADIRPVKKELFLDLLDPRFGLAADSLPEKFEGLAFGPDLPDGRRLLLVTVDNDFVPSLPNLIYAFAVERAALPGFQPQRFQQLLGAEP